MKRSLLLSGLLALAACAQPLPIEKREWMLAQVASNFESVFGDAGVLRPRFGLPAVIQVGAAFPIELLEREGPAPQTSVKAALLQAGLSEADAAACGTGCAPLELVERERLTVEPGFALVTLTAHASAALVPGGYDLYLTVGQGQPARLARSVWLRAEDPATLSEVRVAHLSDLHIGKGDARKCELIHDHVDRMVTEVNRLQPDLVLVTGDLVNMGTRQARFPEACSLLARIDAPVLVVIGNHDHGFDRTAFGAHHYGAGWYNFARAFHPYLFFRVTLGGWDFLGFDSGPSEFSPLVLTRGLLQDTVKAIRHELDQSFSANHRGVVLFSHAPSRALFTGKTASDKSGLIGRMEYGAAAFERVLLDAAGRGQQVLHLSGHTHWMEVFEAIPDARAPHRLEFVRWDHQRLWPGDHSITSKAALINTQSASHSTYPLKDNGAGYGFTWLLLGVGPPHVDFRRYDTASNQLLSPAAWRASGVDSRSAAW